MRKRPDIRRAHIAFGTPLCESGDRAWILCKVIHRFRGGKRQHADTNPGTEHHREP